MSAWISVISALMWTSSVKVGDRAIMMVHVVAPEDRAATFLEAGRAPIRKMTRLEVRSAEEVGLDGVVLDRCEGSERLSCWLRAASSVRRPVAFLMMITVHRDRTAVMLMDLGRAADELAIGGEELENRIFEHAVTSSVLEVTDPRALFERLIRVELREQAAPSGNLRIAIDRELTIRVDGEEVGRTGTGATLVESLLEGERTVELVGGDGVVESVQVVAIRAGATTDLIPSTREPGSSDVTEKVALWSGVALSAVGSGIVVWALAAGSAREIESCTEIGCGRTERAFETFGDLTGGSGGPLAAPFGYSLTIVGATFAVLSLIFDRELAWLPFVIGAGLGATSYTLSALLD